MDLGWGLNKKEIKFSDSLNRTFKKIEFNVIYHHFIDE